MAQLLTDYMYRRGRYKDVDTDSSTDTLVTMARTEAALVPSLTAMAKQEMMETRQDTGYRVSDL